MKQKTLCLAVVSMLTIALGSAWGAGTYLPFGDGFEGGALDGALNTNAWYTSATGVARSENAVAKGYTTVDGSDQAAYISDELSFVADTASGNLTNVWCSFYTKVTAQSSDAADLDTSTVAGFFVKSDGTVKAWSNDSWSVVATGIPTSGWLGFAAHLDYGTRKWDIYKTPNSYSYGDELVKLNTSGALALHVDASGVAEFSGADIEGTTYLDELAISEDDTPAGAAGQDNAVNAAVDIILGENLTGVLTKYFDAADSYMDGPLGTAISSGLVQNDVVYVYTPGSGWSSLVCDGPGLGFTPDGAGLQILPTTAIFVDFAGSGTRAPATVQGYDTFQQPAANVPVASGWNCMAVPLGAGSKTLAQMNFPKGTGDQLWIKKLTGGYEVPIYYNGANWMRGRTIVDSMTLSEGQAFWYRRSAVAGVTTWDASGLVVN
jgi:hypothetical protein